MDSRTTTQELKPFLRRVAKKFSPVKVILFGSRARGDARPHSDYDLLIVSPAFQGIAFYDRHVRTYKLLRDPIDADLICLTPREFARRSKSLSIIGEAARKGVEITT